MFICLFLLCECVLAELLHQAGVALQFCCIVKFSDNKGILILRSIDLAGLLIM